MLVSTIFIATFHNNKIVIIILSLYNNALRISSFPKWLHSVKRRNKLIGWIWHLYIKAIFK